MRLLSATNDGILGVWDVSNGAPLARLFELREGRCGKIACIVNFSWNSDDSLIAGGDCYGRVVVWAPPLSRFNTSNRFISLLKFKVDGDYSWIYSIKF
jgi:WD40 repeat protein